jgi:predicted acylesterase/phospholipase RssA
MANTESPQPRIPFSNSSTTKQINATGSDSSICSIGIALSGGGLRAVLFHLGVIRFLSEANLLCRTKRICSISGGSVLSAHLVLNWEQYLQADTALTGSPHEPFSAVSKSLIRFARSDVRGKILRRTLLYLPSRIMGTFNTQWRFSWSNTGRLQRFYEDLLYGESELIDLERPRINKDERGIDNPRPHLYLLSTNLTKLDLCYFDHAGFQPSMFSARAVPSVPAITTKISYAVAASSAFPGFFGPLEVNESSLRTNLPRLEIERQQIADGGIFDNLGLRMLRSLNEDASKRAEKCDFNIISDAGRSYTWEPRLKFPQMLSTPLRATDVLMARVGQLEREFIPARVLDSSYQFINIGHQFTTPDQAPKYEESSSAPSNYDPGPGPMPGEDALLEVLPHLRTDFDKFSTVEIRALVQHGYCTARRALWKWREPLQVSDSVFFNQPWEPINGGHRRFEVNGKIIDQLYRGRNRVWGFWRFWTDPQACIPFIVLLAIIVFALAAFIRYRNEQLAMTEDKLLASATAVEAASHRRHMYDVLRYRRKADGFWGAYKAAETWTTSQAVSALCLTPETTADQVDEYVAMIGKRFESYDYDITQNAWSSDSFRITPNDGNTSTFKGTVHSTPSLWLLNAISAAKQFDDKVSTRPNQQALMQYFDRTKEAVKAFQGADGGWRMYLTDGENESNSFSTAYALMGLLEAQKAGFRFSEGEVDDKRIVEATITWFEKHFVEDRGNSGWTETGRSDGEIRLGLTCQIFSILLRAESDGFSIPERLLRQIPIVLESQIASNVQPTIDRVDVGQFRSRPVHFVVYPWAVSCVNEYVRYLDRQRQSATARVKFRRILHELVANLILKEGSDERNSYKFALALLAIERI